MSQLVRAGVTRVKISALGTYVPPRLLTNADLEKMVETTDQWIMERTGIRERHIVDKGVATSDLAAAAAPRYVALSRRRRTWADRCLCRYRGRQRHDRGDFRSAVRDEAGVLIWSDSAKPHESWRQHKGPRDRLVVNDGRPAEVTRKNAGSEEKRGDTCEQVSWH